MLYGEQDIVLAFKSLQLAIHSDILIIFTKGERNMSQNFDLWT